MFFDVPTKLQGIDPHKFSLYDYTLYVRMDIIEEKSKKETHTNQERNKTKE